MRRCGERLCVGAVDGLWLFDGARWERRSSASGALPSDWVVAATTDGARIFAATYDGGLARLDGAEVRRFGRGDGLPEVRVNPHALALERGVLLAGTPSGLLALEGDSAARVSLALPTADVTAVAPSSCGGVWLGFRGGLVRVRLADGEDA
ncbi:MAG: hypothetical protein ACK4N5_24850 [Myxococcales bacterium]